jgi:hypothetical protein
MLFINVPTWYGARKVLKAFLFWFYIHFISKVCEWGYIEHMWPLFRGVVTISVFSSVPPISLSHMFLVIRGFEYLIYSCSLRGPLPLVISSFCLDLGPSILLNFPPFFGCFVLVTFGKFSSFITGSIFKLKTSFARSRPSHPDGGHFYETWTSIIRCTHNTQMSLIHWFKLKWKFYTQMWSLFPMGRANKKGLALKLPIVNWFLNILGIPSMWNELFCFHMYWHLQPRPGKKIVVKHPCCEWTTTELPSEAIV